MTNTIQQISSATSLAQEQIPTATSFAQEQIPTATSLAQEQIPTATSFAQEQIPTATSLAQEQIPTATSFAREQEFKKALGNYPTGVTVVTTFDEQNKPIGLTVNSFASVSLDPLLILWSIAKKSGSSDAFIKVDKFAVNILADDQDEICNLFASKVENRFSQCDWNESERKLPVLLGALSQLECKTVQQIDAGDHIIFIGEVIHIENNEKNPLLYHRRNLGAIPDSFYK